MRTGGWVGRTDQLEFVRERLWSFCLTWLCFFFFSLLGCYSDPIGTSSLDVPCLSGSKKKQIEG